MAKFIVECFDERGESLEAHCAHAVGDPYNRFSVELFGPNGPRGQFVLDVPAGVTIGAALKDRIHSEGIHAHN